ncbi:TPA: 50S ribosomal protein L21 [Candidatus Dojkabacteria bacterium]|jgi:large subunit ribosomal protein L21|uniref:Large ribosomal subunit protein bL21 n=1 Tax=Candidatus Dojkabacteria bacterium TaxID=2099670 RepID=A0A832Q7V5_9BACT|nr:50S ribosomal protein L21 [Candidatus Dojkabacteria bacterium]
MADKKETKATKKTTTDKKVDKKATPKKEVKVEAKKSEKFAVIAISGVQLKVFEGMGYEVSKLEGKKGDKLEIKEVLLISDGKDTKVGTPYIDGATVKLEITSQKKGKKIEGFTYKAKSRQRRRYGYRPSITRVLVKSIS